VNKILTISIRICDKNNIDPLFLPNIDNKKISDEPLKSNGSKNTMKKLRAT